MSRHAPILVILILSLLCNLAPAQEPPARRVRLGVKIQPTDGTGVLLVEIMPGFPAETSGLKPGDLVVKIGDDQVQDIDHFRDAVGGLTDGTTLPFTVQRDGQEQIIQVKMTPPRADAPGGKPPTHPELRAELLEMREKDQAPRQQMMPGMDQEEMQKLGEEMRQVDETNRNRLKEIIDQGGFPTVSMVAQDGASAAFLIVQHADADPQWQASMLPVIERLATNGEASRADLAYLTDRVLRAQGKPQRYGTQYFQEPGPDGAPVYVPPIVEDPANLDKRRLSMGLGPWAAYEAHMAKMQDREPFAAVRGP